MYIRTCILCVRVCMSLSCVCLCVCMYMHAWVRMYVGVIVYGDTGLVASSWLILVMGYHVANSSNGNIDYKYKCACGDGGGMHVFCVSVSLC